MRMLHVACRRAHNVSSSLSLLPRKHPTGVLSISSWPSNHPHRAKLAAMMAAYQQQPAALELSRNITIRSTCTRSTSIGIDTCRGGTSRPIGTTIGTSTSSASGKIAMVRYSYPPLPPLPPRPPRNSAPIGMAAAALLAMAMAAVGTTCAVTSSSSASRETGRTHTSGYTSSMPVATTSSGGPMPMSTSASVAATKGGGAWCSDGRIATATAAATATAEAVRPARPPTSSTVRSELLLPRFFEARLPSAGGGSGSQGGGGGGGGSSSSGLLATSSFSAYGGGGIGQVRNDDQDDEADAQSPMGTAVTANTCAGARASAGTSTNEDRANGTLAGGFGFRLRRVKDFVSAEEWTNSSGDTASTTGTFSGTGNTANQNSRTRPAFPPPAGYEVSVRALKGGRLSMEDEFFVSSEGSFAAVFDGHGGGGVSSYLRERLYGKFRHHSRTAEGDFREIGKERDSFLEERSPPAASLRHPTIASHVAAFRLAFEEVEKEVCLNDDLQYQGSTAVAVVVHTDEDGTRTLLSANIGDSRAVLSRRGRAIDLTRDHKPNDEREKTRILAMGEHIEWDHYCKVHRVRNLSLSRAIGDRFAKPAVSGEVEIKRFPVVDDVDEFILLASDGLWDVMSSQEAVSFVHKRLRAPIKSGSQPLDTERAKYARRKNMSRFVANEALKRGSGDNVCVVMVWLKGDNSLT